METWHNIAEILFCILFDLQCGSVFNETDVILQLSSFQLLIVLLYSLICIYHVENLILGA